MMAEMISRPFTAASFNQFIAERKLAAAKCSRCSRLYLPPRAICPNCHGDQLEWVELSGKGRLAAFTAISIGPSFMNELGYGRNNPYVTGIVALEEGVKISARILGVDATHPETIQIGVPLVIEFVQEGEAKQTVLAFRA